MKHLPSEIITHIASFLPLSSIGRLSCVSSRLREILQSDQLWQRLVLRDFSRLTPFASYQGQKRRLYHRLLDVQNFLHESEILEHCSCADVALPMRCIYPVAPLERFAHNNVFRYDVAFFPHAPSGLYLLTDVPATWDH